VSDPDNVDRPATFREVLASGEYRALYLASALSWFGDYVARAAITALVFQQTKSVAASAAAFAISYVPWLGFGPVLAALAERLPYRQTMITADLIRMVLVALVAVPGMPVWGMIVLLFGTALCNPPFDAARSALLAKVLTGDRYVVGLTLQTTSHQAAQVAGYLSGAGLSAIAPQAALLFNAATFGLSALLIALQVQRRPAALPKENRSNLLRETASGLRLVFSAPLLRGVAIIVFLGVLFAIVPEGLAAAWAATLSDDPERRGWIQGTIMVANPVGFIVGGLVAGRLLGPKRRQRLIRVFAIAVPATLVPAVLDPPVGVVLILSFLCGAATAGLIPATNGLFVQALPSTYRARAFGVMKSGIQVLQGLGVFITGWLADRFNLSTVIGVWGILGVVLMGVAVLTWPSAQQIADEIAKTRELNKAAEKAEAEESGDLVAAGGREQAGRRPSPYPRAWPSGDPDPRYGDPWGNPYGPAIGRARVVPRDPSTAVIEISPHLGLHAPGRHAAAEPAAPAAGAAASGGGRHSSDAVRRRISQPIGRIYSTEAARARVAGAHPEDRPAEDPAATPTAGPNDARFTTHQHAVQQHTAHRNAVQQDRSERLRGEDQHRPDDQRNDPIQPRSRSHPHPAEPL
jgi:MFS family permease